MINNNDILFIGGAIGFISLSTVLLSTGHLDNQNIVGLAFCGSLCLRRYKEFFAKNKTVDVPLKRSTLRKLLIIIFFIITLPIVWLLLFSAMKSRGLI